MIADAQALVAVATKRGATAAGTYLMPKAVEEELAMAYAHGKPILLFVENGVDTSAGFVRGYCTFLDFDRSALTSPSFLEKAVHSIHEVKCGVLRAHDVEIYQLGEENLFCEKTFMLADLVETPAGLTWRYSITKRHRFTAKFIQPLKGAAFAAVPVNVLPTAPSIKWSHAMHYGSKAFSITPTVESESPSKCEIAFQIDPPPENGDVLEYSVYYESPYLTPLYDGDVAEKRNVVAVDGKQYLACEGIIPIVRTEQLRFQVRLPRSYGVACSEVKPFVGSYTTKVDYIVPSEMKRMRVDVEDFGGTSVITLLTESPLLGHIYGVAWNPPPGKTS
jgi:hypothetical protein